MIVAAKAASIRLIAYTSVLRADTSPLAVTDDHRQTRALLKASGVPFVLLRNGWYTENYTFSLPMVLKQGEILGSAGESYLLGGASRLCRSRRRRTHCGRGSAGRIYELAGDEAFTMQELTAEISRQSGIIVTYRDLPEAEYKATLAGAGMPELIAATLARSSAAASRGALFDDSHQLSRLIGRPTTLRGTIPGAQGLTVSDPARRSAWPHRLTPPTAVSLAGELSRSLGPRSCSPAGRASRRSP